MVANAILYFSAWKAFHSFTSPQLELVRFLGEQLVPIAWLTKAAEGGQYDKVLHRNSRTSYGSIIGRRHSKVVMGKNNGGGAWAT